MRFWDLSFVLTFQGSLIADRYYLEAMMAGGWMGGMEMCSIAIPYTHILLEKYIVKEKVYI